jgi:DNA repair protein RadA/Sms
VAAAIASSFRERRVPPEVALLGEVGLGGELRAVTRVADRVREAERLGFKRCVLPASSALTDASAGGSAGGRITLARVSTLAQAIEAALE